MLGRAAPHPRLDKAAAGRLSDIVCNSEATRRRVEQHWEVPARVLYPPVRTDLFRVPADETDSPGVVLPATGTYLIAYGRWISYKAFDHAIRAAAAADVPLVLCGGGPEEEALRALARELRADVTFLVMPPTDVLVRLVRGARGLLFPGIEDFGIVPLEAQAAGVPVVALGAGGALETVVDGSTGFLLPDLATADWADAIGRLGTLSADACRANADRFSEKAFDDAARSWLNGWGFCTAPLGS